MLGEPVHLKTRDPMCCKGGKLLLGIVALALLAGGGVTAYFLLREPPAEERPSPPAPEADRPGDPWRDYELKDEQDSLRRPYRQLYYSRFALHVPGLQRQPPPGTALGSNYLKPADPRDWRHPDRDFSRLPTTYYHRGSPVGVVMERFNWFGGRDNTYASDARLPASLVALAGTGHVGAGLPLTSFTGVWSEPPYGTLGMSIGTMASYARPLQVVDLYENSKAVRELGLPSAGQPKVSFVHDAKRRGAGLRIFAGDERDTLAKQGPERFYHALVVELCNPHPEQPHRNLLTKEAMAVCF